MPDANDSIYDWDEDKRALNLRRHGLDFEDVAKLDLHATPSYEVSRGGEKRWIAFFDIGGLMHAVVYTVREERIRIISFRRARRKEEARYAAT